MGSFVENPADQDHSSEKSQTKGVKLLLGDPKIAIRSLSLPMVVAMLIQTLYNIVDAFWVAGLGPDALAAIGFAFPFFFMAIGLSNGLGIGGGSAVSRWIGARDKENADNVAIHTLVIMVIVAVAFTIPLFVFADQIFAVIGAGHVTELAVSYGRIIFLGTILIFFTNIAYALLRGEGDVKRAMYAMLVSAGLNIILDPIFIYSFGMGVAGAAWATVISLGVTSLFMLYWMAIKRDTYVSLKIADFSFDKYILWDILRVGIPASVIQISMAITMLIMNVLIVMVASTDGVAVYSIGWRVVMVAITPLLAIATAVVSVCGASYGAHLFRKTEIAHLYATKIGFLIGTGVAIGTYILAPQIAAIFTFSEATAHIAPDLAQFFRIVSLFYPAVAFGMFSSSLFQGTGKGMYSLIVTILRTLILATLLSVLCAFYLGMGLEGIWWGLVGGNTIGSIVGFIWARYYMKKLLSGDESRHTVPAP